ncbi:hypothetical protein L492_0087 [Bordetella bronchiseptica 7E71]|nr:hypothetical protein L492_0087 [Bordetella bronchiseptica 7E71]
MGTGSRQLPEPVRAWGLARANFRSLFAHGDWLAPTSAVRCLVSFLRW